MAYLPIVQKDSPGANQRPLFLVAFFGLHAAIDFPQSLLDSRWDKSPYIATQRRHLPDYRGIQVGVLLVGHQEHGDDVRRQSAIHQCHLEFVFEIGDCSKPSYQRLGSQFLSVPNHQTAEGIDFHALDVGDRFPDHLQAVIQREEGVLLWISTQRHDDAVEDFHRPLDDVQMPIGNRVERPRIDSGSG